MQVFKGLKHPPPKKNTSKICKDVENLAIVDISVGDMDPRFCVVRMRGISWVIQMSQTKNRIPPPFSGPNHSPSGCWQHASGHGGALQEEIWGSLSCAGAVHYVLPLPYLQARSERGKGDRPVSEAGEAWLALPGVSTEKGGTNYPCG